MATDTIDGEVDIKACMWAGDSGAGSCTDYRVSCEKLNDDADKCNAVEEVRFEKARQACIHSSDDTSSCNYFNACTLLENEDKCNANNKCEWLDGSNYGNGDNGSCDYIDTPERNAGATKCVEMFTQKECAPLGTDPAKHCAWILSTRETCANYDQCSEYSTTKCPSMAGCKVSSDKASCESAQNNDGQQFYDCSNTTDAGEKACNMLMDKDGARRCIFVAAPDSDDKEPVGDDDAAGGYVEKDRCATYDVCLTGTTTQEMPPSTWCFFKRYLFTCTHINLRFCFVIRFRASSTDVSTTCEKEEKLGRK